ncbi:hypothetical protein N9A33_01035 [Gammaproteobacteria bacterium]|nr:hypothetical protein [Gammaproteobacteria bacterium]
MKECVISPPSLELFLARLKEEFGQYLVLRGYDYMPNGYTNDIDVYIPREDLTRFFSCVNNLEGLDSKLVILVSRFGLIKCELMLDDAIIPFDIMYGFYYVGLEYQDCNQLSNNSKIHSCGSFFIPNISDEVRISLLKELLHNGRVRSDKADYLLKSMDDCAEALPTNYFNADTIKNVRASIISKNYYVPKISLALKVSVFKHNIKKHWAKTFRNILLFVIVKYFLKNKYHENIVSS